VEAALTCLLVFEVVIPSCQEVEMEITLDATISFGARPSATRVCED
jgi:hypothetical protein